MPYSFNFDILNADENTKYLNMAIFQRISNFCIQCYLNIHFTHNKTNAHCEFCGITSLADYIICNWLPLFMHR